jgi:Tfp pilus assembly protein PilX
MTPQFAKLRAGSRGFAIVSAIFILVVLAALGAFIVNVSTNQQIGSTLDLQGVRAYQAARAGIEWGIYQVQATPAYNFSYGPGPGPVGSPSQYSCLPRLAHLVRAGSAHPRGLHRHRYLRSYHGR